MEQSGIRLRRRFRRKKGIRKRVFGTCERPRLTVFRSHKGIYAQIIDDERGVTICQASTQSKDLREQIPYGGNIAAAKIVGAALAKGAKTREVERVCFDRNGYRYHGRVKALAEAVREGGVRF